MGIALCTFNFFPTVMSGQPVGCTSDRLVGSRVSSKNRTKKSSVFFSSALDSKNYSTRIFDSHEFKTELFFFLFSEETRLMGIVSLFLSCMPGVTDSINIHNTRD